MYRGLKDRSFFFLQAIEFGNQHRDALPEHIPTPEEIDSGLAGISEDFGFFATLIHESERLPIAPNEFLRDWNVQEFYNLIKLHAWEAHAEKEYSKLMSSKMGK